jgi:hypothetical protein
MLSSTPEHACFQFGERACEGVPGAQKRQTEGKKVKERYFAWRSFVYEMDLTARTCKRRMEISDASRVGARKEGQSADCPLKTAASRRVLLFLSINGEHHFPHSQKEALIRGFRSQSDGLKDRDSAYTDVQVVCYQLGLDLPGFKWELSRICRQLVIPAC